MKTCDFCKRENLVIYNIKLPRRKRRWVKDAYGTLIMPIFNGVDFLDTSICQSCVDKMASILPEVTVDE